MIGGRHRHRRHALHQREQEGRVEMQHMPFMTGLGELRGAVGAQWTIANARPELRRANRCCAGADPQHAAFIFEELQLTAQLRLQAAARIEQANVDGNGLRSFPIPACPWRSPASALHALQRQPGALYELPLGVVARLKGQYVERAPDAAELFSKGVHEATGTFEIGNPFLDKEKAGTVEVGFKRAQGAFRFDASVYYSKYNGFIYKQLTGVDCGETLAKCGAGSPGNEQSQVLFQQRNATFYGAELAAQYDMRRSGRRVGRRRAIRLRARAIRRRRERAAHPAAPPRRRRLLSRCELVGARRAPACLQAGRDRRQRDRDAGLHARLRATELHDQLEQGAGRWPPR